MRSFDPSINRLTVVANESYVSFAKQLQTEIEADFGVQFEGRIMNKRERRQAVLKKGWRLDPDFVALWDRIKPRTRYSVQFDTERLIEQAALSISRLGPIEPPRFQVAKVELLIRAQGVTAEARAAYNVASADYAAPIPDLLGYLQRETELTRPTLAQILIRSGRLGEVARNPQQFLDQALKSIRHTLHELMVDGIKYERIAGQEYEMLLFEEEEINGDVSRMLEVRRSIYDAIEFDSEVERRFAEALDQRTDIRLFEKLPSWFKVETPLGTYNPDWAIVKQEDATLYLVRETKGTTEQLELRESERRKIQCGAAHFQALGVDYRSVATADQV